MIDKSLLKSKKLSDITEAITIIVNTASIIGLEIQIIVTDSETHEMSVQSNYCTVCMANRLEQFINENGMKHDSDDSILNQMEVTDETKKH